MPVLCRGTMLIRVSGLTVDYAGVPAVTGVSLDVDEGEIVTLIGPNGSGKSTVIRAILGGVPIRAGTVKRAPGLRIGYVPQKLMPDATFPMTVRRFLSLPRPVADADAAAALARTGVADLGARHLSALSGGQLQRVLLARALLTRPGLFILDEPTQGLDPAGVAGFYRLIEDVRRDTGAAILLVSHDLHVVMRATDRVICLNGHVCCEGSPDAIRRAPEYRALYGSDGETSLAIYEHHHDHAH